MSEVLRKNVPLAITFLIGMVLFVEWFLAVPQIGVAGTALRDFGVTVSAFALGLGAINLFALHGGHIKARTKNQWIYSLALLAALLLFIIVGVQQGVQGSQYKWIYNNIIVPLSATMYGAIGFYIASGAYRALRARTKEATVLLITGVILLLRNAPIGPALWDGFPIIGSWIMDIVTTAVYRGIMMGSSLGILALGIRTLIGMERGYLGRE
jgi:hypothetical protein